MFLPAGSTVQCNWTCHQRPPVLRDHIFMANLVVLQGRFYCATMQINAAVSKARLQWITYNWCHQWTPMVKIINERFSLPGECNMALCSSAPCLLTRASPSSLSPLPLSVFEPSIECKLSLSAKSGCNRRGGGGGEPGWNNQGKNGINSPDQSRVPSAGASLPNKWN